MVRSETNKPARTKSNKDRNLKFDLAIFRSPVGKFPYDSVAEASNLRERSIHSLENDCELLLRCVRDLEDDLAAGVTRGNLFMRFRGFGQWKNL